MFLSFYFNLTDVMASTAFRCMYHSYMMMNWIDTPHYIFVMILLPQEDMFRLNLVQAIATAILERIHFPAIWMQKAMLATPAQTSLPLNTPNRVSLRWVHLRLPNTGHVPLDRSATAYQSYKLDLASSYYNFQKHQNQTCPTLPYR